MRLRVIPLGTSAGRPTLSRGASALAIATEGGWVLCDCGENAQIAAQRAGLSLARLDAVLITHLHGDHFNGLPGLLGTLGLDGRTRPLLLAGPKGLGDVLATLVRHHALGTGALPLRLVELEGEGGALPVLDGAGPLICASGPLSHRVPTFGYRVRLPDRPGTLDFVRAQAEGVPRGPLLAELKAGRAVTLANGRIVSPTGLLGPTRRGASVAYALDTVPCAEAVRLAQDVDLLVHEATYESARAALAHARGHSTATEAARIAQRAGVHRLLLTHFSPSVEAERLAEEARVLVPDVTAARDGAELELVV